MLAAAIAVLTPNVFAQSWNYVAVTHHGQKSGEWDTNLGKAAVTRKGPQIHIEVTFEGAEQFGPAMHIDGQISANGIVRATATYLATDQTPDKLTGTYRKRISQQLWGKEKKRITSEEIIFPYPQNWQFMAFQTESASE